MLDLLNSEHKVPFHVFSLMKNHTIQAQITNADDGASLSSSSSGSAAARSLAVLAVLAGEGRPMTLADLAEDRLFKRPFPFPTAPWTWPPTRVNRSLNVAEDC